MKKNVCFIWLVLMCLSCTHRAPIANIKIGMVNSNRAVQISGFDKAVVEDIGRDTASEVWQSLLPVYKMPADTDMKDFQNAQPGHYKVMDSLVVFTPDTAFKKGQVYFVRWYRYDKIGDALQYIRGKKKVGSMSYKDLLFRY
jgi:hypothetical protein